MVNYVVTFDPNFIQSRKKIEWQIFPTVSMFHDSEEKEIRIINGMNSTKTHLHAPDTVF